jgi:hypothetical protein
VEWHGNEDNFNLNTGKGKRYPQQGRAMDHIIGKNCVDTAHNYFPAHWMLRIITGERRFLKLCKVDKDDIDNAFQGMKLSK